MRKLLSAVLLLATTANAEVIAAYSRPVEGGQTAHFLLSDEAVPDYMCAGHPNTKVAVLVSDSGRSYDGVQPVAKGCWYPSGDGSVSVTMALVDTRRVFTLTFDTGQFTVGQSFPGWGISKW
jgi:hypothetical protein